MQAEQQNSQGSQKRRYDDGRRKEEVEVTRRIETKRGGELRLSRGICLILSPSHWLLVLRVVIDVAGDLRVKRS
eukprot:750003-Hanusia_phi.AAC.1